MDCLLDLAEGIKGGKIALKGIFEKLTARTAGLLVNEGARLSDQQKQRAAQVLKW